MPPTRPTDEEQAALLDDCKQLLMSTLVKFNEYEERVGDSFFGDKGSTAQAFKRNVQKNKGPDGFWNGEYADKITKRVFVYLQGARHYLGSMLAVLREHPYGPGLAPLTRCTVEAGGKVAWLLDNTLKPFNGTTRERVARLLLDQYDDAQRRKTLMEGLQHSDRARAGREYHQSKKAVTRPGVFYSSQLDRDRSGDPVVHGQDLPGVSRFVVEAERIFNTQPGGGEYVYGYLSAVTHPSVFGYVEFLARDDVIFCAKLTCYAVLAFYNSIRCFHGWTQSDVENFPEWDFVKTEYEQLVKHYERYA